MPIDEFLGLKYKLTTSENFDEFMKALGVGLVVRKMGNAVSPVIDITKENGEYVLKSSSTFKNTVIKFKLGVEFDEETPDGRTVKSVITVDPAKPNTLIHVQKGEKETKIVREFSKDEVTMKLYVDDIVCTRVYKLQE